VAGVVRRHAVEMPGVQTVQADLTDFPSVTELVSRIRPDAVIHCAAESQPNACQQNPAGSRQINVEATLRLAELCAQRRTPFVFTSTDLVFDGEQPPYREDHPVAPISIYGMQKAEAEEGVLQLHPLAAVCRMPLMFGDPSPASRSFIQPLISTLTEGKTVNLFVDEFRTPVSAETAAQGLLLALRRDVQGLLHLGGRQSISRFEFGRLLVERLSFDPTLLKPLRQKDLTQSAPRPRDVSLDSSRAFGLGYDPPPLARQLDGLRLPVP
jgi:dTDP-4-dehydrorhamnose reductase